MREVSFGPVVESNGMPSQATLDIMSAKWGVMFSHISTGSYFGPHNAEYFDTFGEAINYAISEFGNVSGVFNFLGRVYMDPKWHNNTITAYNLKLVDIGEWNSIEFVVFLAKVNGEPV